MKYWELLVWSGWSLWSQSKFDGLTEFEHSRQRWESLWACVVHEVKQNKENQESAVFLNSRPLRLPFGCRMSDVRHDWEDFSMDSGTDPFAKCQLLLEIRFWWMRMQNSQTEPGVAARFEVNPSKAPMFCLRRLEIVSEYPAQKPSAVALANHFSEKHAWGHRGYWFSLYSSRYLARQRHSYRHPHASTCQILTTRRVRFTSCDVTRILIRRQNLSPCRAANVAFRARKKRLKYNFQSRGNGKYETFMYRTTYLQPIWQFLNFASVAL